MSLMGITNHANNAITYAKRSDDPEMQKVAYEIAQALQAARREIEDLQSQIKRLKSR